MAGRVGEMNVVGVVAVGDAYPSANTTDWLEAMKTRRDRRLFSVADVAASQPRRGLPRPPIAAAVGASRPRSYSRRRGDDGRSRADAGAGAPTSRVASRQRFPR